MKKQQSNVIDTSAESQTECINLFNFYILFFSIIQFILLFPICDKQFDNDISWQLK